MYDKGWLNKYIHQDLLSREYDLFVDEVTTNGIGRDIYCFPAFTDVFCDDILRMADKKNDWGKIGHEHYTTYDTWLESLGMNEAYSSFIEDYKHPLAQYVYTLKGLEFGGSENFIAKYLPNHKHSSLAVHIDDSDYSIQVSLSGLNEYGGGGTWYPKQKQLIKIPKGYALMHPGNAGFGHGARRITSGERYQLVSFIKFEKYEEK